MVAQGWVYEPSLLSLPDVETYRSLELVGGATTGPGAGEMLMAAVADKLGSETAVTVTSSIVFWLTLGATYKPDCVIVPPTADQLTRELGVPLRPLVNCKDWPASTVAEAGATLMEAACF